MFKALAGALLLGACAGVPSVQPAPVTTAGDDVMVTVLASRLPSGASACALAQPRWVPLAQRPLMIPLTTVDSLVWSEAGLIDAYAEADQRDRMGPGASVRLIRFRGELSEFRAYMATKSNFAVRWDEAASACLPDRCVVSARLIAPNVVRLDRGIWRDRVSGAEAECAAMAREHPHAAELSFRGTDEMSYSGGMVPLLEGTRRIDAGARVVRLVQRDRMDSVEAAQVLAGASVDLLHGRMGSLGAARREQSGNVVITTTELTWDDLRIGIADRARESDNRRYAELLIALEPDDSVDPTDTPHAVEQLRLRLAILEHEPASESLLRAAIALAERVQAVNPNDAHVAQLLVKLQDLRATQTNPRR